jgi:hypothetical protein
MREKLFLSGLAVAFVVLIGNGIAFASSAAPLTAVAAAGSFTPSPDRQPGWLRLAQVGINFSDFNATARSIEEHSHHHGRSDPNPRRPPGGAASLDKPDKPEYATEQSGQAKQTPASTESQSAPSFSPSR